MWRTNRQIWVTKNSKLVVKTWSLWIVQRVERTIRQKTKKCPRVLFRAFQDSNQSSKLGIMPRWDKEAPENRKSPYSCDPREEEVIGAQKEYLMVHKWNPKLFPSVVPNSTSRKLEDELKGRIVTTRVCCTLGSHFCILRKITYRDTPKIPNEVCEIRYQALCADPG